MTDFKEPAENAAKAVAGALVRHVITIAGTAIVARGYTDQDTADSITGPIGDYVVGSGLAVGAACWGGFRAWLMHARWIEAWISPARPLSGTGAAAAVPTNDTDATSTL